MGITTAKSVTPRPDRDIRRGVALDRVHRWLPPIRVQAACSQRPCSFVGKNRPPLELTLAVSISSNPPFARRRVWSADARASVSCRSGSSIGAAQFVEHEPQQHQGRDGARGNAESARSGQGRSAQEPASQRPVPAGAGRRARRRGAPEPHGGERWSIATGVSCLRRLKGQSLAEGCPSGPVSPASGDALRCGDFVGPGTADQAEMVGAASCWP